MMIPTGPVVVRSRPSDVARVLIAALGIVFMAASSGCIAAAAAAGAGVGYAVGRESEDDDHGPDDVDDGDDD